MCKETQSKKKKGARKRNLGDLGCSSSSTNSVQFLKGFIQQLIMCQEL